MHRNPPALFSQQLIKFFSYIVSFLSYNFAKSPCCTVLCHLGPVLFTLKEWIMYIILATMSTRHRPRHIPHNPESSSSGVLGIVGTLVNNEVMGAQGDGRR